MDSFIFYGDYAKQIQFDNLQQITGGKNAIIESAQLAAVEECKSYLKQKFDISEAFRSIVKYSKNATYKAGQPLYLDAPLYTTKTYAIGEWAVNASNVYQCKTAITVAEPFTLAKWDLIGEQYTVYYAIYPQEIFNYLIAYSKGDMVFWRDKVYECQVATSFLSHDDKLQINHAGTNTISNVFPDDKLKGVQFWGVGIDYTCTADKLTDTDFIVEGDIRDQKLLQICIDIILYHTHCRISPRNIPEMRINRYMGETTDRETRGQRILYPTYCALGWLQAAAIGNDITPSMPVLQPEQGKRIMFGGNQKQITSY